jgi:xanthine dehydrogenase accessory factor
MLESNAFYIGAQGSKSAHSDLLNKLEEMGSTKLELSRLRKQIGLIPSARNPRILAISVLADVIDKSIKTN